MVRTRIVRLTFLFALILTLLSGFIAVYAFSDDDTSLNGFGEYVEFGPGAPYYPPRAAMIFSNWDEETMLTERGLTRRQEGLEIRGTVPHITPEFGFAYNRINRRIAEYAVSTLIEDSRRGMTRTRSITFNHRVYTSGNVVSLVIFAEIDSSVPRTLVRTVNFNANNGRIITLRDAASMDIVPLIERRIADMVRGNPVHYYAAQSADLHNLPFYLTDDYVVVLFGGLSLSTRNTDVSSIDFNREKLYSVTLFADEVSVREYGYSLKRIPLRRVAEALGFGFMWDSELGYAAVLQNGRPIISMSEGDNTFTVSGTVSISLEEGPLIIDADLHVPITFFEQVLPLTFYDVSQDGRITFVAYQN